MDKRSVLLLGKSSAAEYLFIRLAQTTSDLRVTACRVFSKQTLKPDDLGEGRTRRVPACPIRRTLERLG